MKKILYAAAECSPFVKTGGLGSVVGSLPKQLVQNGCDVRVALPAYECIPEAWKAKMKKLVSFPVRLGWRNQYVTVKTLRYQGVVCYFLENAFYYSGDAPYSDITMDIEKFSFFDKAVLEMLSCIDFLPDVIHCHDWQSALIPVYLKAVYAADPFYRNIRTVMTIHNMKFQGITGIAHMQDVTGLPDSLFTVNGLEYCGGANMLKGGIAFADKVTTVSETYAREIQDPEYGEGLDGLLRYRNRDLSGIVNGIDYQVYAPMTDEYVKYHYNSRNYEKAKKKNKTILQNSAGLPADKNAFCIGIIARLTEQKGFGLLEPIADELLKKNVQLYVLGSGEARYEEMFGALRERYPAQVFVEYQYDDPLAKRIYAGCDAVLMPSRFEPCGLCQLMALRYGTIPIARATGGLCDTIVPYREKYGTGTGFLFRDYTPEALSGALTEACALFFHRRKSWDAMAGRALKENYSWAASAKKYKEIYEGL